jgi:hypothetical protein
MGMYEISLVDALFTRGQQRVLGILFSSPDQSFLVTELIARAGGGSGAVHRELARLAASGIVTMTPVGRQRRYQANSESPIFAELRALILKTVGLVEPLQGALAPLRSRIQAAFVYGLEATEPEVKVMIIADQISSTELLAALDEAQKAIGRPIDPVLFTPGEWRARLEKDEGFAKRLTALPKIFVIGAEGSLT